MPKRLRRLAALLTGATAAISLSGCVASAWQYDSPPAAGTQTDLGGLKLRNFLVISDTEGNAILTGAVTSRDNADSVLAMALAPEVGDAFGTPQELAYTAELRKGETIYLDGSTTKFTNSELSAGRLAQVQVAFGSGQTAELLVPVLSSTHPDFAAAWDTAHS